MLIPVYSSTIRRSEMDAVLTCMVEEKVGPGEVNQKLIKLIRELYGVDGALVLRSPALALFYALKALDLPEKAGVLLSALAPAWQYTELIRFGFTPMVLDVDPTSALVTLEAVEDGIKQGGRALVLHETLGNMPDMAAFTALSIPIIEDISQSAGAYCGEQQAGCCAPFAIHGLEEHDIITAGGGAFLFSADRRYAALIKNYVGTAPVTDVLPDINGSLALVQLKNREKNRQLRAEIGELYMRALLQTQHKPLAFAGNIKNPVYSFPVILESGFKEVKAYVNRKGAELELAFAHSIIQHINAADTCMHAASLALRTVLFPLYPRLGAKNAAKIAKIVATLP